MTESYPGDVFCPREDKSWKVLRLQEGKRTPMPPTPLSALAFTLSFLAAADPVTGPLVFYHMSNLGFAPPVNAEGVSSHAPAPGWVLQGQPENTGPNPDTGSSRLGLWESGNFS